MRSGTKVKSLGITLFPSEAAQSKAYKVATLEELRDGILATSRPSKAELPWLKAARFGDKRSKKNALRHDDNVLAITGICVDYDEKKISVDEIVKRLREKNLFALIYTSAGHKNGAPKWRIVLPLFKEIVRSGEGSTKQQTEELKTTHRWLVARVNGLVDGELCAVSFNLSQSYYYGAVDKNPDHQAEVIKGRGFSFIDQRGDLDAGAMRAKDEPTGVSRRGGDGNPWAAYGAKYTDKAPWGEWMKRIHEGTALHDSTRDICAALRRGGTSAGTTVNLVRAMLEYSEAPQDDRWHDRYDEIPRLAEIDDDEDEPTKKGRATKPRKKPKPPRTTRKRWREIMADVVAKGRARYAASAGGPQ
jgi:hypothetical protein